MHADFSRDSFEPTRNYSRVVQQQGRFLLDADFNEQTSIQLHSLRELAKDLFGPHWGPSVDGFKASASDAQVTITSGRYYAGGMACDVPEEIKELKIDVPARKDAKLLRLIYLEAWERHLSAYETNDPSLTDPALGHYDGTTRARVVWRVRAVEDQNKLKAYQTAFDAATTTTQELAAFETLLELNGPRGGLYARVAGPRGATKPGEACAAGADAAYYGAENQLFRVEIHSGGRSDEKRRPTFKWSRDNASAVFPIVGRKDDAEAGRFTYSVQYPAGGLRSQLKKGDWVEFLDENYLLGRRLPPDPLKAEPRPLYAVQSVKKDTTAGPSGAEQWAVTVSGTTVPEVDLVPASRPFLRRWESAAEPVGAHLTAENFARLRDGLEVRFDKEGTYHRGDFWLIPARTAQPFLLWPDATVKVPPRNPPRAFAPLLLQAGAASMDLRVIPSVRDAVRNRPRWGK